MRIEFFILELFIYIWLYAKQILQKRKISKEYSIIFTSGNMKIFLISF